MRTRLVRAAMKVQRWASARAMGVMAVCSASLVCSVGASTAAAVGSRSEPVTGGGVHIINKIFDVEFVNAATCSITRSGFTAKARRYNASLVVHIEPFTGYHQYVLRRGSITGHYVSTFIDFKTPSGVEYASNFVPPFPIPNAGAIHFSPGGGLIGIGMHPMFDANGESSVIVAGGMSCHYSKRHR
jgi:hypothetical protein